MFREVDAKGIFLPSIRIAEHPKKGYICIATKDFEAGELIERCPTIKFAANLLLDMWRLNKGRVILHDYNFTAGSARGYTYFAMGYGGIYSHADDPNAIWRIERNSPANGRDTLIVRANKPIKAGEEITVKYVIYPKDLWFEQSYDEEDRALFEHSDADDVE